MARSGNGRAFARGRVVLNWAQTSLWAPIQTNHRGNPCVAQALPTAAEIVRCGNSWQAIADTGDTPNGAGVSLFGSNATGLAVVNGEPPGGKSYVIDSIGMEVNTNTSTLTNVYSMWGHLFRTNCSSSLASISTHVHPLSLSGKATSIPTGLPAQKRSSYGGRAQVIPNSLLTANGAPLTDEGLMHPIGRAAICQNTVNATFSIECVLGGRYIIPPLGAFTFQGGVSSTDSVNGRLRIIWHEVQLTLG